MIRQQIEAAGVERLFFMADSERPFTVTLLRYSRMPPSLYSPTIVAAPDASGPRCATAQLIASMGVGGSVHADFGNGLYNGSRIGIPYVVVHASSTPKSRVSFEYADESDKGPYPIPANPVLPFNLGVLHHTTLPYSPYQNAKQESFWGQIEGRLRRFLGRAQ